MSAPTALPLPGFEREASAFLMVDEVAEFLAANHYLGAERRGVAWRDARGVMVFRSPSSRRIPKTWLELSRWCLDSDERNAGSRQWSEVRRRLLLRFPNATTVVSYSDPAHGHTGALYRACGWLWAPTWHVLRPPPSGNGKWSAGNAESVKHRFVYPLRRDAERAAILAVEDASLRRRFGFAEYREPVFKGRRFTGGGGDFKRWEA